MFYNITNPQYTPRVLMQRAGYSEFTDPRTGEISYTRRLGTHFYPRFHVYIEAERDGLRLNLHLDQKQPSYPGFRKHSGEYNGTTVEAEMDRILHVLTA